MQKLYGQAGNGENVWGKEHKRKGERSGEEKGEMKRLDSSSDD